jgi:hypothetical protein
VNIIVIRAQFIESEKKNYAEETLALYRALGSGERGPVNIIVNRVQYIESEKKN